MSTLKQYFLFNQLYFIANLFPTLNYLHLCKYNNESNSRFRFILQLAQVYKKQWFLRYRSLMELTAIDFPQNPARFRIVYHFLSYSYTNRLLLSSQVNERDVIHSLTNIYSGACWQEREVWDLFGVFFKENPDLRRILTDYGFFGHPLRKDFPLTGFYEIAYDDRKKQIIYRPVSLAQEYRPMHLVNPWVFLKKQ